MQAATWSAIGILAAGLFGFIFSFSARLDAGFGRIDEKFGRMEEKFDRLEARLDAGFARIDHRLDQVNARLGAHIEPPHAG